MVRPARYPDTEYSVHSAQERENTLDPDILHQGSTFLDLGYFTPSLILLSQSRLDL